jgi:hypothetical protein
MLQERIGQRWAPWVDGGGVMIATGDHHAVTLLKAELPGGVAQLEYQVRGFNQNGATRQGPIRRSIKSRC